MRHRGKFRVFVRNWWKLNPAWPGGLEPDPCAHKHTICYEDTEAAARDVARAYNANHKPGKLSRKAEVDKVG